MQPEEAANQSPQKATQTEFKGPQGSIFDSSPLADTTPIFYK